MSSPKVIVFGVDGLIPELVYKFAAEGHIPNISQMMEQGASTELLPYISTWGDVNWMSFMTAQAPGTSWKGQAIPPSNKHNLLGAMNADGKKCALVHFPETLSAEGTNHFQFAPFWSRKGNSPFELASPAIFTTNIEQWPVKQKTEFLGWPAVGTLAHHEKRNARPMLKDAEGHYFEIMFHDQSKETVRIHLVDESTVTLSFGDGNGQTVQLTCGEWSGWTSVSAAAHNGFTRFKLLALDVAKEQIDILQSQITKTSGISNDSSVEQFLIDRCGPFISKWTVQAGPDELYMETSYEEGEYQANWLAEAALGLLNERSFDLFATVFRLNDETHHTCLGEYDPASPFYTPERAAICEAVMRRSYEVLDRAIGKMMSEKSEDTVLILASDHGDVPNAYLCDVYTRLEQTGLCKLDEAGMPVWGEAKAYLKNERGGLEVYVNLIGRDPNGIVEQRDYEQVKTQIFQCLSTWCHETPKGTENVAGIVLKKQDAAAIGYWGDEMGDVIFAYNQGFVWGFNERRDVVAPVSTPGANHGPQIPSAATDHSSNYGIAIMHGPQIAKGVRLGKAAPYLMNDAGTTIAELLGTTSRAGIDGRIMHKLLVK